MVPRKIEKKIREVCGDDTLARDVLIELLKYEDSGKGRQKQNCKSVVEKYAKEVKENENRFD